jgi:hypothetical protein
MAAHAAHANKPKPAPSSSFIVSITDAQIGQTLVPASGVILSLALTQQGDLTAQLVLRDANGVPVVAVFQNDLAGGRAFGGAMNAAFDGSLVLSACPSGSTWSLTAAYA